MHSYATLTPGTGFRPDWAALYYAQRLAILPHVRRAVAHGIAAGIRALHPARHGPIPDGATQARLQCSLAELRRDGLAILPATSPERIARIRDHLQGAPVLGPDGRAVALDRLPVGTATAAYPLPAVLGCSEVCDLVNDPNVLELATRYLGCAPTLSSIGLRWSMPGAEPATDTQMFHRDVDDWRFLKLFIYLTDVDADGGPHVFVNGSHRTAARLRARPYDRPTIEREYAAGSIRPILGAAGTSFMADTFGIHRGGVPVRAPRLILSAQYSLLPIFAFVYQPITIHNSARLDPYVNRLLLQSGA